MSNFKMILPEIEVADILKSEIDDTILFLIEFKENDFLKNFLRKIKQHIYVDLYITEKQFKAQHNNKNLIELNNIELLAFCLNDNSSLIKFHNYEYVSITDLRIMKIKTLLK